MKNWRKALDYFVTGMGFGAIIYLVILGVTYENIGDLRVPLNSAPNLLKGEHRHLDGNIICSRL